MDPHHNLIRKWFRLLHSPFQAATPVAAARRPIQPQGVEPRAPALGGGRLDAGPAGGQELSFPPSWEQTSRGSPGQVL